MNDFSGLPDTLSRALVARGYSALTQVQVAVAQPELSGLDLLVSAQTGSGKTVGFGLAIAPDLLDSEGRFAAPATPLALVIAPTRELALQVRQEFDWLFAEAGIVTASSVGGMDARAERIAIERGAHVVVATPGRLRDHVARGTVDLSDLRAVVLDEADEMLDMGFSEDLEFILDRTPPDRRTLLFSATVPDGIARLARTYQKDDARRIEVGDRDAQHSDIAYRALSVAPSDIEKAIVNILRHHDARTAIVFANTRSMVARLAAKLSNRGFPVVSLSGELSQAERTNALQSLRDGRARVCIATDVAARGIDLPGLDLVIHADLPSNAEGLLHRSGRTGRAGRKGTSVLIVPARQRGKAQRLLKSASLEAEWGTPPSAEAVLARDEERLMADPAWQQPPSEEERAFAERLAAAFSAETIAAAYLRLFRERHSAPEILEEPDASGPRKPRDAAAFGPSTWFSLSLGRKQRAEPRWLLPMLCRNAGIPKDAIGAIRVQYEETFVEILTAAVPAMKRELGPELALEQGARLTELPGAPDPAASPKGPPAAPRRPAHRAARPAAPAPAARTPVDEPAAPGDAPELKEAPKPGKERAERPARKADRPSAGKPRDRGPGERPAKFGHAKPGGPRGRKHDSGGAETGGPARESAPAAGPAKKPKRFEKAADPSAPLGRRGARHKGGKDAPASKPFRPRTAKGPDARPRKPPRKKD